MVVAVLIKDSPLREVKVRVTLVVDEPDEDLLDLIDELEALDVDRVEPVSAGLAPKGTRAGEAVQLSALAVTLGPLLLQGLIVLVQDWLQRRRSGTVRIRVGDDEIELSGASSIAQQQALDAFLSRHSG
jgi:hypothetical protein